MKLLIHEGVVGSLKYSTADKVFYGKIQGVEGVFHITEIRRAKQ